MFLVLLLIPTTAAWACEPPADTPFEFDDWDDGIPPLAPELASLVIERGRGPVIGPDGEPRSGDCDDLGTIVLTLRQPADDHHEAEDLGYRFHFVEGRLPGGMAPLDEGIWAGPTRTLRWKDGASDDQEPFAFTLAIMALDGAGLASSPLHVEVSHEGSVAAPPEDDAKGCATAPGAPTFGLGTLGAFVLRRRARAASRAPRPVPAVGSQNV